LKQAKVESDVSALALDSAHSVAFHTGLGAPLYPSTSTPLKGYLDENAIAAYAETVFTKSSIALVGDGATTAALSKWTEQFFKGVPASPSGSLTLNTKATTYYGGEQRTAHTAGNSLVIAFPGSSFGNFKPEIAVLASLLGGQSSVKWSPGFTLLAKAAAASSGAKASATNLAYSDAGLLTIQVSGAATAVRIAAHEAVKALKSIAEGTVSKEDLTKAIAKAKFDALVSSESGISTILAAGSGIVHTGKPFQIAETAKSIEGVTADKLKTVRVTLYGGHLGSTANYYDRLRRHFSTERLPLPRLATCSLYPTRRSLALRYRWEKRKRKCTNNPAHRCKVETSTCAYSKSLRAFFVHIHAWHLVREDHLKCRSKTVHQSGNSL
jgi:ubiquinol-cytochrome c reductase core subunit 2